MAEVLTIEGFALRDAEAHKRIDNIIETATSECAINVKDCGAVGDGNANDTQAFIDAFSKGNRVYVPEGDYKITGVVRIPVGATLFGSGWRTFIHCYNGGFTLNDYCTIEGLTMEEADGHGTAITVTGSSCRIDNVHINGFENSILITDAMGCVVHDVYAVNPAVNGIVIESPSYNDRGDHRVINCTFDNEGVGQNAILLKSGGGLILTSNKILHFVNAVHVNYEDVLPSSVFIVDGNSFELIDEAFVKIGATNSQFSKCIITNNQFMGDANIRLGANVNCIIISGNFCDGHAEHFVDATSCGDVVVTNNMLNGPENIYRITQTAGFKCFDNTTFNFCGGKADAFEPASNYIKLHPYKRVYCEANTKTRLLTMRAHAYRDFDVNIKVSGLLNNVGAKRVSGTLSFVTDHQLTVFENPFEQYVTVETDGFDINIYLTFPEIFTGKAIIDIDETMAFINFN